LSELDPSTFDAQRYEKLKVLTGKVRRAAKEAERVAAENIEGIRNFQKLFSSNVLKKGRKYPKKMTKKKEEKI
jgi:hypothetical protein